VRVLVVDDHPITRHGLAVALAGALDVDAVDEAGSGEEALVAVAADPPDVVFMDLRMGGISGIEATRRIRERNPEIRVVIFTVDESRASLAEALRAGVSGYLLKDLSPEEVLTAARDAVAGRPAIHPKLAEAYRSETEAIARESLTAPAAGTGALTDRERSLLQDVARGVTTSQLAERFGLPATVVRAEVDRIVEKLAARDRAQAVAIAARRGLLDPPRAERPQAT
jgi:DNA-binding NarL/FixJ family response regulator